VREIGVGPPVVVIHGGPDFDHGYLVPEVDQLARSCHLIYYDQRGRGRSPAGADPPRVSMADEVADLERIRVASGLRSMALLGHSWGGLVALEYALAHPDRVTHLVLMNTAPASHAGATALFAELARRRGPDDQARMDEIRRSADFAAGDLAADAAYYRIHYGSTLRDPALLDALVDRLRRSSSAPGVRVARAIERQLLAATWSNPDYDLIPQLARLRVPILVVHGDDDLVPLSVAKEIVDALPDASLVVIAETGHFGYLERPDAVLGTIAEFLSRSTG
jgi:proline-specific peptidase